MKQVFELVKSFLFEFSGDQETIRGKLELFQNIDDPQHFRFATSEADMFSVSPTFPRDEDSNPIRVSDETIWVERTFPGGNIASGEFTAENPGEACKIVLEQIKLFEDHLFV